MSVCDLVKGEIGFLIRLCETRSFGRIFEVKDRTERRFVMELCTILIISLEEARRDPHLRQPASV